MDRRGVKRGMAEDRLDGPGVGSGAAQFARERPVSQHRPECRYRNRVRASIPLQLALANELGELGNKPVEATGIVFPICGMDFIPQISREYRAAAAPPINREREADLDRGQRHR